MIRARKAILRQTNFHPFLLSVLFLTACTNPKRSQPEVYSKGALKDIMHKGDLAAKYSLQEFDGEKNIYALGAVEDLKGEILILNSKTYISSVREDKIEIENTTQENACLLVYSEVEDWEEIPIPNEVKGQEALDTFVKESSQKLGFGVDQAFPFQIKGKAESVRWHVINWPLGDMVHTHEKHKKAGLNGELNNVDIEILGFYSENHKGIYTHHSSNLHMHFITADQTLSAHLDDIEIGEKMVLRLPK